MTLDLRANEAAGSRSLHRLVRQSSVCICNAEHPCFYLTLVDAYPCHIPRNVEEPLTPRSPRAKNHDILEAIAKQLEARPLTDLHGTSRSSLELLIGTPSHQGACP